MGDRMLHTLYSKNTGMLSVFTHQSDLSNNRKYFTELSISEYSKRNCFSNSEKHKLPQYFPYYKSTMLHKKDLESIHTLQVTVNINYFVMIADLCHPKIIHI